MHYSIRIDATRNTFIIGYFPLLYTFTWPEHSHWISVIKLMKDYTLGKLQVRSRVVVTPW